MTSAPRSLARRRNKGIKGTNDTGGSHHYMLSKQVGLKRIKTECTKLAKLSEEGKLSNKLGTEGPATAADDVDE